MNRFKNILISIFLMSVFSHSFSSCYSSYFDSIPEYLCDSIPSTEILLCTGLDEKICGLDMKKWPYLDSVYIVYAEDSANYQIFLIKESAPSKYNVLTSSIFRHEKEYRFSHFDFAPYRLKENNTAIGIRFKVTGPTMGGAWSCEMLKLFEIHNKQLKMQFSTITHFIREGNSVAYDYNTAFYEEYIAIVIIGKSGIDGYNQIITKVDGGKAMYNWDGNRYLNTSDSDNGIIEDCWCD